MSDSNSSSAAISSRDDNRCEWRPKPKRPHCKCISTDQPPKRPDPAIYSQPQRLSSGQSASWESPDIQTNWWDDWRFMDSIQIRIHNESNEASAVNTLQVQISHPHDKVPDNNLGYQAIHGVRTSQLGRSPSMTFAVVNASAVTQTITLVVLANDLGAAVTPANRVYAPGEQVTATLTTNISAAIVPPAGGFLLKEATVVGYDSSGRLLGAVPAGGC